MSPAAVVPFSSSFTSTAALSGEEKDRVIEWYRGEFAAANAIIDALCHHLVDVSVSVSSRSGYDCVFSAIHRRRVNWIPVLQTQKYFTIADVALQLRRAAAEMIAPLGDDSGEEKGEIRDQCEEVKSDGGDAAHAANIDPGCVSEEGEEDSPVSDITDTGSHEAEATMEQSEVCDNHEKCIDRREQIKLIKGFVAKEPMKGRMVNMAKGLKMFEDVFTVSELCKLRHFVDELRVSGQNGQLSGETYMLFNKQDKTNKREQIQLGVPLFGHVQDEAATNETQKTNNEPIPEIIQSVIDHLVQWQVLPENRKPNGCIINYFDEGEHSQPFLKPPHLDQPLCTIVLSESEFAFGRTLVNDGEGNFKGQLLLSLKQGSILVMRSNSADMARHAMCSSPTRRVSITLTRVRPERLQAQHSTPSTPLNQAMTLWQPAGMPDPQALTLPNRPPTELVPKWGVVRSPLVMLAPVRPVVVNPRKMPRGGTGVFFPWTTGSRKLSEHLPPRVQKRRLLALSRNEGHICDTMSDPGV